MATERSPEQQVRRQLTKAGPDAVRFLVQAMKNEELPCKERIEIARDILNRGFGKTLPTGEEAPTIRVLLSEEAAGYAE